ncbi:hypothetical protein [Planctomyces sp. SH-PL14]|uniref:hypothetical protein n=1 Tax=Planctomyces sp. SH-PL14 TaxID=1632864 RepID=UPI00078D11AD|nr:hypothetical protein [Planctomyces sp. SH-PL14]AMV18130.1 hypothetical protein VT03_09590 [Planctomyces sp. SH-PL14]
MNPATNSPDFAPFTGYAPRVPWTGRCVAVDETRILTVAADLAPTRPLLELLRLSGEFLILSGTADCLCRVLSAVERPEGLLLAVRGVALAEMKELIAIRQGIEVVAVQPLPEAAGPADEMEVTRELLEAVDLYLGAPLPPTVTSTLIDRVALASLVRLAASGLLEDAEIATLPDPQPLAPTVAANLRDAAEPPRAARFPNDRAPFSWN